jgi:hypothetical protein
MCLTNPFAKTERAYKSSTLSAALLAFDVFGISLWFFSHLLAHSHDIVFLY